MISTITVSSWNELEDELFYNSFQPSIKRHRTSYVFRGISDFSYTLQTSLQRLCGDKIEVETSLLRNFKKYASEYVKGRSFWDFVSLAQHHGLPTRLLDWTNSPFVALHFATENLNEYCSDCAIWMVDIDSTKKLLPETARKQLINQNANLFTTDMLNEIMPAYIDMYAEEQAHQPFVVFFEPPSIDERIINQYALFSVMSNPSAILEDWLLSQHEELGRKIIIPSGLKWLIRDRIDQMNINERTLYPGLDGLSSWLKRYYYQR